MAKFLYLLVALTSLLVVAGVGATRYTARQDDEIAALREEVKAQRELLDRHGERLDAGEVRVDALADLEATRLGLPTRSQIREMQEKAKNAKE